MFIIHFITTAQPRLTEFYINTTGLFPTVCCVFSHKLTRTTYERRNACCLKIHLIRLMKAQADSDLISSSRHLMHPAHFQ